MTTELRTHVKDTHTSRFLRVNAEEEPKDLSETEGATAIPSKEETGSYHSSVFHQYVSIL